MNSLLMPREGLNGIPVNARISSLTFFRERRVYASKLIHGFAIVT
jgi:hypothetical protein